ncbi:MAG: polyprenyl synthetase family protein [Pseudobutyrivibrio sp.]|nr:polyprenyl synthetase family protein [Pseudobutyrivibrio sp.]
MTNLKVDYDTALQNVKKETTGILRMGPSLVTGYTAYMADTMGKMLRARAVLASSMDSDGLVPQDAVLFASAIEILHLATLVHDDIMDDADTRRGQVSLQKKSGKRNAVICGDYLLAAAMNQLAKVKYQEKYENFQFSKYIQNIALGELRQTVNNRNYRLSVHRYLSIIDGKTAALFEASYHSGALAGDADAKRANLFKKLGRYTGVIFQLTDDCIDFDTSEEQALKPVMSDYENGVITLPIIHTFQEDPSLLAKAEAGQLSKEQMLEEVKSHEGVKYTHAVAEHFYKKALSIIDKLELQKDQEEILGGILHKAYVGFKG